MKVVCFRDALPKVWARRIETWTNCLGRPVDARLAEGESWWLIVDADEQPQACLRWRPALGRTVPRPHFHVGRVVHASPELQLFQTLDTLQLGHDLTGHAELADLALAPEAEAQLLLDLVPAALADVCAAGQCVIVELQGERDEAGRSPFWLGLGRHFYSGDPDEAWRRFGDAWLAQLAGLLPRQTIYPSFLSAAAQQAVGKAGPAAAPAVVALQRLGWVRGSHVRPDDGGPVWMWRVP